MIFAPNGSGGHLFVSAPTLIIGPNDRSTSRANSSLFLRDEFGLASELPERFAIVGRTGPPAGQQKVH